MRFTSFHVPLPYVPVSGCRQSGKLTRRERPNPKNMSSTYLKADTQTLWARNAARAHAANKNRALGEEIGTITPTEVCLSL